MTVVVEERESPVRAVRKRLGLTQPALADALGVCPRTVLRWEHGARVRRVYMDRMDEMLSAKEIAHEAETDEAHAERPEG